VENRVIEGLRNWLREYQAKWNLSKPQLKTDNVIDIRRKALQNLEKELSELEKQKGRLHDLLERGVYDEETFLERSRTISERIDATKAAINNAEKALNDEMQRIKAQVEVIPMIQNALDIYPKLTSPAEKNNLLKSILEYGTYRKEKFQKGDEFTLVLFPKLPN
jgi:chromosome segregation ATPase